jgi:hypothetical protein
VIHESSPVVIPAGNLSTDITLDILEGDGWEEDETLILEAREQLPPIQTNLYGHAAYRANDVLQIPIFDRDQTSFSEEIMSLFASFDSPLSEA